MAIFVVWIAAGLAWALGLVGTYKAILVAGFATMALIGARIFRPEVDTALKGKNPHTDR